MGVRQSPIIPPRLTQAASGQLSYPPLPISPSFLSLHSLHSLLPLLSFLSLRVSPVCVHLGGERVREETRRGDVGWDRKVVMGVEC